jgi:hypothetical protein
MSVMSSRRDQFRQYLGKFNFSIGLGDIASAEFSDVVGRRVRQAGREQYFYVRNTTRNNVCQLDTVHVWHADIGDEDVKALAAIDDGDRFGAISGRDNLIAKAGKHAAGNIASLGHVVNEKDVFLVHLSIWIGRA